VDIVGEADEVEAAIEMILERNPDVVLLDVHMPTVAARPSYARSASRTRPRDSSRYQSRTRRSTLSASFARAPEAT